VFKQCGDQAIETEEAENMKRAFIFLAVALTASFVALAEPQTKGTASISGVVIGPDDKPAAHASVSYQFSDGTGPHAVFADSHGHFTISQLKANSYDVRASAKGIFSDWQRNIPLRKGQSRTLELHLIYAKEMPKPASDSKPKQ
jgi:Carboxypeptidase regulatory-like domain